MVKFEWKYEGVAGALEIILGALMYRYPNCEWYFWAFFVLGLSMLLYPLGIWLKELSKKPGKGLLATLITIGLLFSIFVVVWLIKNNPSQEKGADVAVQTPTPVVRNQELVTKISKFITDGKKLRKDICAGKFGRNEILKWKYGIQGYFRSVRREDLMPKITKPKTVTFFYSFCSDHENDEIGLYSGILVLEQMDAEMKLKEIGRVEYIQKVINQLAEYSDDAFIDIQNYKNLSENEHLEWASTVVETLEINKNFKCFGEDYVQRFSKVAFSKTPDSLLNQKAELDQIIREIRMCQ